MKQKGSSPVRKSSPLRRCFTAVPFADKVAHKSSFKMRKQIEKKISAVRTSPMTTRPSHHPTIAKRPTPLHPVSNTPSVTSPGVSRKAEDMERLTGPCWKTSSAPFSLPSTLSPSMSGPVGRGRPTPPSFQRSASSTYIPSPKSYSPNIRRRKIRTAGSSGQSMVSSPLGKSYRSPATPQRFSLSQHQYSSPGRVFDGSNKHFTATPSSKRPANSSALKPKNESPYGSHRYEFSDISPSSRRVKTASGRASIKRSKSLGSPSSRVTPSHSSQQKQQQSSTEYPQVPLLGVPGSSHVRLELPLSPSPSHSAHHSTTHNTHNILSAMSLSSRPRTHTYPQGDHSASAREREYVELVREGILTASSEVDPHSPYHSGYDGSPGSGAYAYQDSPEMIHTSSSSARQSTSSSHFHNANPSVMPSASPSMISYISAPSHSMLPASLSSTIREERVYASKTLCSPQVKRDRARSDKEEVSALLER
ncbi:hypothetical protein ADUPG1_011397, partial [Aduncisulcus paluster]